LFLYDSEAIKRKNLPPSLLHKNTGKGSVKARDFPHSSLFLFFFSDASNTSN